MSLSSGLLTVCFLPLSFASVPRLRVLADLFLFYQDCLHIELIPQGIRTAAPLLLVPSFVPVLISWFLA